MEDDALRPMGQLSAHLDRGWDLVSRGDFAGAMVSAEESLELDEASPEAHNLIGYIYQAGGRPEEAMEHFQAALELDEGYVEAMLNAADLLIHPLRKLDEARELVREALEWLPDEEVEERTDALLLMLEIHLAAGETEAARKVARELPTGPFENPAMPLSVGRARLEVGDVEAAEPLLTEALARTPTAEAHYYMALLHEARGRARDSVLAFLQARELDLAAPSPPWSVPPAQFERRVQSALARLEPVHSAVLEGALVVVTDLPGAEVVAEGVDPRTSVLLDAPDLPPAVAASDADTSGEAAAQTTSSAAASSDAASSAAASSAAASSAAASSAAAASVAPIAPSRVTRLFVYRRNVERVASGMLEVEDEILRAIVHELTYEPPQT